MGSKVEITQMIHVLAIIVAKPGQRDALLTEFRAILAEVRAEEGCLEYGPAIDVPGTDDSFGPDTFVVIEKWSGTETLAAHAKAPHMVAYGDRVGAMVASRTIHVLEPC